MGQRANLIVLTEAGLELYYSHWRANTLDRDLFWGPGHATAFARAQRSEAEGAEWLDDVWSEGGAVIDHTRKTLTWYGGEDTLYDAALRRTHGRLMAYCWRGWTLRWASEGMLDLARACGVPEASVLTRRSIEPCELRPAVLTRGRVDGVITIVVDGVLRIVPMYDDPSDWFRSDRPILPALQGLPGLPELDLAEVDEHQPKGGLHIDTDRGLAGFWIADACERMRAHARVALEGLTQRFWGDGFERHLAEAGGRLRFPPADVPGHVALLRSMLLGADHDAGQMAAAVAASLEATGRGPVEVNPLALRDDPVEIPASERGAMLQRALEAAGLAP